MFSRATTAAFIVRAVTILTLISARLQISVSTPMPAAAALITPAQRTFTVPAGEQSQTWTSAREKDFQLQD